jgi:PAS domain S-box-containing protein
MAHRSAPEGSTVLVTAPFGRDAESAVDLLRRHGYAAEACRDLDVLAGRIDGQTGVVLVTEEALRHGTQQLVDALADQPKWSDVPFILLATRRNNGAGYEALRAAAARFSSNVMVLERPVGTASLLSTIASAIRSRQRQFDMRDRLLELEQGRRELAESEQDLRTIADALPVLIGFVDREGRYRFANRAFEDWFGIAKEEVVGREARLPLGRGGYGLVDADISRALAGEPVRMEVTLAADAARRREAAFSYLPRRDPSGQVDGFHLFALDITDRKRTEEDLAIRVKERTAELESEMASRSEAEAALRQSQKMEAVGQLTGGIAHDFNNMLTGVIGSLDIIRRRIANGRTGDLDRFIEAASVSAQRAAGLTARLLAFSRRQSLDLKPVPVNELVASLEDLLRRTVKETVALKIVRSEDVSAAIADANQLENAVLNLAINARDAMPDGGQLTIETRRVDLAEPQAAARADVAPGTYVVIAVSDTGVGMAPELLEKVFDPFFTTKPIGQGTGLGLSMVYGFAKQAGGHVRIHSRPGEGTTVSIYLVAADPLESADGNEAFVARDGHGQSVLLVEDDPSVRLLVREVLQELSYVTIEAEEANAAIRVLESTQPIDLMISDVGLPGMNGRQLAEVARQHRPDLPVLFVTGYAENAAIRAGFLGTNMAMITKPFAMDALAEKISALLGETAGR